LGFADDTDRDYQMDNFLVCFVRRIEMAKAKKATEVTMKMKVGVALKVGPSVWLKQLEDQKREIEFELESRRQEMEDMQSQLEDFENALLAIDDLVDAIGQLGY